MSRFIQLLSLCGMNAALCVAAPAVAAPDIAVACSVSVDYVHNGVIVEAYRRDFVVDSAVPFRDDFSTPTRQKSFAATTERDGGTSTVKIDYFSDVGVFHAIGFNTTLTVRGGGTVVSTSGSATFSASSGVTPASVAGNHSTNYMLACQRA